MGKRTLKRKKIFFPVIKWTFNFSHRKVTVENYCSKPGSWVLYWNLQALCVHNWNSWGISNCLPKYTANWIYNCHTTIISTSALASLTCLILFHSMDFEEGLWKSMARAINSNILLTDLIATDSPNQTLLKSGSYFLLYRWLTQMQWSEMPVTSDKEYWIFMNF